MPRNNSSSSNVARNLQPETIQILNRWSTEQGFESEQESADMTRGAGRGRYRHSRTYDVQTQLEQIQEVLVDFADAVGLF